MIRDSIVNIQIWSYKKIVKVEKCDFSLCSNFDVAYCKIPNITSWIIICNHIVSFSYAYGWAYSIAAMKQPYNDVHALHQLPTLLDLPRTRSKSKSRSVSLAVLAPSGGERCTRVLRHSLIAMMTSLILWYPHRSFEWMKSRLFTRERLICCRTWTDIKERNSWSHLTGKLPRPRNKARQLNICKTSLCKALRYRYYDCSVNFRAKICPISFERGFVIIG